MPFMEIQVTDFIPWIEIDTTGGSWSVMQKYLSKDEKGAIDDESKWNEVFSNYAEGYDVTSVERKDGIRRSDECTWLYGCNRMGTL